MDKLKDYAMFALWFAIGGYVLQVLATAVGSTLENEALGMVAGIALINLIVRK